MGLKLKKKKIVNETSNQFAKGLGRLQKVTVCDALARRFTNWTVDEFDPQRKAVLALIRDKLAAMETLRHEIVDAMTALENYTPPVRNHTGELKLVFGRQVWIKPKFLPVYSAAYSAEQLEELRVLDLVNGRVVLLIGPFDPNDTDNMPRAVVPKIHLTANPPTS